MNNTFVGTEDAKLVLDAGGGIVLADPDSSDTLDSMVEVKLTVGVGNLHLPLTSAGGLYLLGGDQPGGSNEFWARGGLPELNRSLKRIEYRPPADWSGIDRLDVWVGDLGQGGRDAMLEATAEFVVIVSAVDDKPKLSYPSTVHYLDEDASFAIDFVAVSDTDSGSTLTLQLQPDHGTIKLPPAVLERGGPQNVEMSDILSNGEQQVLSLRGFTEDVGAAAQILTYWPPANFAGQVVVEIDATDESGLMADAVLYFYVRPVNDPPTLNSRGVAGDLPMLEVMAGGNGAAISGLVLNDVDVDGSSDLCTNIRGLQGRNVLSVNLTSYAGVISIHEREAAGVRVVGASTTGPGESLFIQGSLRLLQAALDGGHIVYNPPVDFSGIDSVGVAVSDGGNCGAGGVGSTEGILEVNVAPHNPPLVVGFSGFTPDSSDLLIQEGQSLVLPDIFIKGGSVHELAAVEVVLLAVSGNVTIVESNLGDVELVNGTQKMGQRLHLRGSPMGLTNALSGLIFEARPHFFGYWNRNGSEFDDTPVRSPHEQGGLALARVDIVATPDGGGSHVIFDGSSGRPNVEWSLASVKISVGWVNDPPAVETPPFIVARSFEKSPVPGVRVSDLDVVDAPGGKGRLEVTVSTNAGGKLSVDAMVALKNGLRDDDAGEGRVRLHGQPEYLNNVLATLIFQRVNATEGATIAAGDNVDVILVEVNDLGFSGTGGEQRVSTSIFVEERMATSGIVGDKFASEKVLPSVSTTEGLAVALPGLETRLSVIDDDAEIVTVALSAREGYLSLGPSGQRVSVATTREEWGPAVTVIKTTGGAEQTLPEVQASQT